VCHWKGTGEFWCVTGRALVSFGVPMEGHWWGCNTHAGFDMLLVENWYVVGRAKTGLL